MSDEKELYKLYLLSNKPNIKLTLFYFIIHYTDADCISGSADKRYFRNEAFAKKYTKSNTNERLELNALLIRVKEIRDNTSHNLGKIIDCDYFRYRDITGVEIKVNMLDYADKFINTHLKSKLE